MEAPIVEFRTECSLEDCGRKHYGNGFCRQHHGVWKRYDRTSRLVESLGGVCADCGGSFPVEAFDFHHRDPGAKRFAIGNKILDLPMEALIEEAAKCDLVCANCHRLRHSQYDVFRSQGAS